MTPAASPAAERLRQARLERLEILDTPAEPFSDAVAAAAACAANVPMAAISLIDRERQWQKSACGMVAGEIPRADSMCAHAILSQAPLIVADLAADARFRTNPYVTGAPFARFYAGFPIVVDGHSVGALCVIDDRIRALSLAQLADLQDLAADVAVWLEGRTELQ